MIKESVEDKVVLIIAVVFLIMFMFGCLGFMLALRNVSEENDELKQEMCYIDEATILYIDEDSLCVYVFFNGEIWELDVFDETVDISTIQVGDVAIFVYDYNHTDADLINVRKS